jgi:DNA-directed RNA polymerase specialized sigma24 family protein
MQDRHDRARARRAADADPDAFSALFEDCFDRVYAFAARRTPTREAAERSTERTLAHAFARLADYDGSIPFSAWLLGLLKAELRAPAPAARSALAAGSPPPRA